MSRSGLAREPGPRARGGLVQKNVAALMPVPGHPHDIVPSLGLLRPEVASTSPGECRPRLLGDDGDVDLGVKDRLQNATRRPMPAQALLDTIARQLGDGDGLRFCGEGYTALGEHSNAWINRPFRKPRLGCRRSFITDSERLSVAHDACSGLVPQVVLEAEPYGDRRAYRVRVPGGLSIHAARSSPAPAPCKARGASAAVRQAGRGRVSLAAGCAWRVLRARSGETRPRTRIAAVAPRGLQGVGAGQNGGERRRFS